MVSIIALAASAVFGQMPAKNETCESLSAPPIEREMTEAKTHCYQLDWRKDDFSQIRVEQKSIDVALRFFDAKGNLIAEIDNANETRGFENLFFIAPETGVYKLEIVSLAAKRFC